MGFPSSRTLRRVGNDEPYANDQRASGRAAGCLEIISPLRRTIILLSFPSNRPGSFQVVPVTPLFMLSCKELICYQYFTAQPRP